jgi:hypothetical protein
VWWACSVARAIALPIPLDGAADVLRDRVAAERGDRGELFLQLGLLRTMPPLKSVAVGPGAIVLTVICREAPSPRSAARP